MRLAIFSDTFAPEINGVARTLSRLTGYLDKNNIEYKVFAPDTSGDVPSEPHVTRFASLPFVFYRECRLAMPNPMRLNEALQEFKPDLMHIATPFNMGLAGLQYGKKHQTPMVASYHTHFDEYLHYYHLNFLNKWIWNYMRWFHRSMSTVYVPSNSTKEKLMQKCIHPHLEIWSRGVDTQLYSPHKFRQDIRDKYGVGYKHLILYVGRLAPEKNVDCAIQAFQKLPRALRNESHLVLAGDGPMRQSLMTQYAESNITFTGFVEGEELAQLYASADVFLFPSTTETFGNVVLEAMASGVPVIGSSAGGVKHLVQDGETGTLCYPNKLENYSQALTELLANARLRHQYAKNARKVAQTYSWDDIFSRLLASYEQSAHKGLQHIVS